jgi:hypothetical protein
LDLGFLTGIGVKKNPIFGDAPRVAVMIRNGHEITSSFRRLPKIYPFRMAALLNLTWQVLFLSYQPGYNYLKKDLAG